MTLQYLKYARLPISVRRHHAQYIASGNGGAEHQHHLVSRRHLCPEKDVDTLAGFSPGSAISDTGPSLWGPTPAPHLLYPSKADDEVYVHCRSPDQRISGLQGGEGGIFGRKRDCSSPATGAECSPSSPRARIACSQSSGGRNTMPARGGKPLEHSPKLLL